MFRVHLMFSLPATCAGAAGLLLLVSPSADPPASPAAPTVDVASLPLAFQPNVGQSDPQVRWLARTPGATLFLTDDRAVLALRSGDSVELVPAAGAAGAPSHARQPLEGRVNWFVGNDPSRWRTGVPTYGEVVYDDVWPGVDVVFHGNQRAVEYDFVVAPGADPSRIGMTFAGADDVAVDADGSLVLRTPRSEVRQLRPVAWQETPDGRRDVAAAWDVREDGLAAFALGPYDPARELVIDPIVIYSTYLGGNFADFGEGIAVDADGNAYVVGATTSTNFPVRNARQSSRAGTMDAFVAKLNPTGNDLVFSTYLGGATNPGPDGPRSAAFDVALDPSGNAYVVGWTQSTDFPATAGAFQRTAPGTERNVSGDVINVNPDAFVAKLDRDGALVWATYLGGTGPSSQEVNGTDIATGVAVDESRSVFVVGQTLSTNFPTTTNAFQRLDPDVFRSFGTPVANAHDVFVTQLNPGGTALAYSTYLGGNADDGGPSGRLPGGLQTVDVDRTGNIYVAGRTESGDFPVSAQPFRSALSGGYDAFLVKLSTGQVPALPYGTYLGGVADEGASSSFSKIAVDANNAGVAFVASDTRSFDFPTTSGAFDRTYHGGADAFLAKVDTNSSFVGSLAFSTFFGGTGDDLATAVAVEAATGRIYIAGRTSSFDLPVEQPTQDGTFNSGGQDAFLTRFAANGRNLLSSTYFGGAGDDGAADLALGEVDDAYLTGTTSSAFDFPTLTPFQGGFGGGTSDAFVAKLSNEREPSGHDFAVTAVIAPARVKLNERHPSRTVVVGVQIQNRSTHAEVISDLAALGRLVQLQVHSLGACPNPIAVLRPQQQRKLPRTLLPRERFTVFFDVTFDCANDPQRNRRRRGDVGHEDYRYTATVSHEAFDGTPDDHPADDVCPRAPAGEDPFPDGRIRDQGCEEERTDVYVVTSESAE